MWDKARSFLGIPEDAASGSANATRNNILPLRGLTAQISPHAGKTPLREIVVLEPRAYEDSVTMASQLKEGKPLVINLKYLDSAHARRLIDFLCGTAFAINGHMLKVSDNVFLFTPEQITIHDADTGKSFEKGMTPSSY